MFPRLKRDLLPVGSAAPPFILPDEEGSVVVLYGLKGKNVVLIFYPADHTPVCTAQLCEFRDRWEALRQRGIVVYGISPQGAASHRSFRGKHGFPFPLLVDAGQRVAKLYKAGGWIVRRSVYLIGKDSVIRYAKRGKPPVEEVMAAAD
jgi:peroxiredoxin Q/BCP